MLENIWILNGGGGWACAVFVARARALSCHGRAMLEISWESQMRTGSRWLSNVDCVEWFVFSGRE